MKNKKNFLVIGNPIKHSLSPLLHNYWFRKNKVSYVYKKLKINQVGIKKTIFPNTNNQNHLKKNTDLIYKLTNQNKKRLFITKYCSIRIFTSIAFFKNSSIQVIKVSVTFMTSMVHVKISI